ncbi:MAG: radical SAM protein [Verrucomicrobiota bacterium]|nr:radical SAM protein [Verrucomicrobiota bacterium]
MPKYGPGPEPYYNYIFPLGLGYVSATLKKAGHAVDCVNLNHERGGTATILERALARASFDVVMTGGTCLDFLGVEAIVRAVRRYAPGAKIVVGGLLVTGEPDVVMQALAPDIGVIGEGEQTALQLVEHLGGDADISDINGIMFRDSGGDLVATPPRAAMDDIDPLPHPDFEGFGFDERLEHTWCNDYHPWSVFDFPRPYPILGSRGCPFNCTFCWHPERHRARSIPSIMEEVRVAVARFRVNYLAIYDDCFSARKERLQEFCRGMEALRAETAMDIRWSCSLMVNIVDRGLLTMLKSAGCAAIGYGFESYSRKVLKSMRKPITPEQIDKAFRETTGMEITVQGNFIFGDVAETHETIRETLDFWRSSARGQIDLGFIHPFPGSAIYRHCLEKRIIADKLDFIRNKIPASLYNHFNMTDAMTDREIQRLYSTLLELTSRHMPFVRPRRLARSARGQGGYEMTVDCPFCRKENQYGNTGIQNRLTYGFYVVCRSCAMRMVVVGSLQSLAQYPAIYPTLRRIRQLGRAVARWLRARRQD